MKAVYIYVLDNNTTQQLAATCWLDGNVVRIDGDQTLSLNLKQHGIKNYNQPNKRLYPIDGIIFLQQLKNNFKSGYLNATDILEVERY